MRALPFLLLALAAGPASAQGRSAPSGCKEDYATCKEDCSIEFGGSQSTIGKLTRCMGECEENLGLCADRHSSLRGLPPGVIADEPRPSRSSGRSRAKPVSREEDPFGDTEEKPRRTSREEDPFGDERPTQPDRREGYRAAGGPTAETPPPAPRPESTTVPASASTRDSAPPASSVRQGVYRASESEPPPPSPAVAPAPEDDELPPLDEKPAPAPIAKPAPVKAEPVKPAPAKTEPAVVASGEDDEKDPLLDSEPPPPAPVVKKPAPPPTSPTRPALPPEPKEDISVWDPNGD